MSSTSTKAMIFLCAAVKSAKAFHDFNSMNSTTFNSTNTWTEDLLNNSTKFISNNTNSTDTSLELDQVSKIYETMFNNSTNNNSTVDFSTFLNATDNIPAVNNNTITMPAVNATSFNVTSEVIDFPAGNTLANSFESVQGPANLRISTRGPRLTNYDLSGHQMHQVSVANITGDGFLNNSTMIGSEFLNDAEFLYDSEDHDVYDVTSNYTAVDNSTQWIPQASANSTMANSSIDCAHCESSSHGDHHTLDPVTVMSSYISGHMKEHGKMHGLLTIVADVSTEAYNYTVANLTDALHVFF